MTIERPCGMAAPGGKTKLLAIATIVLAFLAGGCAPGPFNVEVSLAEKDAKLRDETGTLRSIEIDLVGVNESELERWKQMPISNFWKTDSPIRLGSRRFVMAFGQGRSPKQALLKADAIWKTWIEERGAKYLVVLAYLPSIQDQPGEADPRRIILPLERGKWEWAAWGADTIPIQLGTGGITLLRQPKK